MDKVIKVDNSEILFSFKVKDKTYCALVDKESKDSEVYFMLRTNIDENNCALTSILDKEIDAVVEEYNKIKDFFESEDELDIEEDFI